MLVRIHPENPQGRLISQVVDCLRKGGVIIYPTDTVYGLGCDIMNKKAVQKLCAIKGIKAENAKLSCLCDGMKEIGEYTAQTSNGTFQLMKSVLPGPYTFILRASKVIPKHFHDRRKTIGIRWVENPIANAIIAELGNPIASSSLNSSEGNDYFTDPEMIHEAFKNQVDMVVDGGSGLDMASTVLDCTQGDDNIEVIREGLGPIDFL